MNDLCMKHIVFHTQLIDFLMANNVGELLRLIEDTVRRTKHGDLYKRWVLAKGDRMVTRVGKRPSFWLAGKRTPQFEDVSERIPGEDHRRCLIRSNGTREVLSQPYQLDWEDMVKLVAWCQDHGLRADVDTHTGHYLGHTLGIHITLDTPRTGAWYPVVEDGLP